MLNAEDELHKQEDRIRQDPEYREALIAYGKAVCDWTYASRQLEIEE